MRSMREKIISSSENKNMLNVQQGKRLQNRQQHSTCQVDDDFIT
jgi:hypothetical protein